MCFTGFQMSKACFVAEPIVFSWKFHSLADPAAVLAKVVFDGCQTSRNALEVLSSFTTEEVQSQSVCLQPKG
jgi:hypothetical protein